MSNENRRPWYRNPRIIVPIIAAIITAIGLIVAASIDDEIIEEPELSTIQGVVTDTDGMPVARAVVEIDGLSGTTDARGGYVIHDVPIGTKTISVHIPGAEVIKRALRITKGGEIIIYDIVIPLVVTPTPTLEIKITSPKEGDDIPVYIIVMGTFSGELPEGQYMWVVINPHPSPGQWWPQEGRVNPWRGQWDIPAWLGREKEDIGEEFDIAIILVNGEDDQNYRDYLRTGQETGSYPGIPLPASAKIMDIITVTIKGAVN